MLAVQFASQPKQSVNVVVMASVNYVVMRFPTAPYRVFRTAR
jgi:hypothetical protein